MSKPKILVIEASVREGRVGETVANWVMREAGKRDDAEYELADLRDYPLKNYADVRHPKTVEFGTFPDEIANKWVAKVGEADGFIIVTPEYNHGYPASLKNALDYPYKQWNNKAVGFVSYGGFVGGARAVEQLRQVSSELYLADVRDAVHIIFAGQAFDENGQPKDPKLDDQLSPVFGDVVAWSTALKSLRQ
jgi:NAD(P)H-dependent FMN reductase